MKNNWREKLEQLSNGACSGCEVCDGHGCQGQVPGMGGIGTGSTFMNNYLSWEQLEVSLSDLKTMDIPKIGVAPMTGVDENMGNPCLESKFHQLLVAGAKKASVFSTIGDGTPDYKLQSGAQALRDHHVKGIAFFKPYPNIKLFERYEWVCDTIEICGLDIDSYKIVTMAGKTILEKKSASQLMQLKNHFKHPFIVKGISSQEDVEMIEEVKPDIVVVSNHGGRVADHQEGIAFTLQKWGERLHNVCSEVWVDGGIRCENHLKKAAYLGADRVLIGRPFIQATLAFGKSGVSRSVNAMLNKIIS